MDGAEPLLELIASWAELPWLDHAACGPLAEHDLDLFFTPAGASISRLAKQLCVSCAARTACLSHAFDHQIAVGYFGGMSPNRRRELGREAALAEIAAERRPDQLVEVSPVADDETLCLRLGDRDRLDHDGGQRGDAVGGSRVGQTVEHLDGGVVSG